MLLPTRSARARAASPSPACRSAMIERSLRTRWDVEPEPRGRAGAPLGRAPGLGGAGPARRGDARAPARRSWTGRKRWLRRRWRSASPSPAMLGGRYTRDRAGVQADARDVAGVVARHPAHRGRARSRRRPSRPIGQPATARGTMRRAVGRPRAAGDRRRAPAARREREPGARDRGDDAGAAEAAAQRRAPAVSRANDE